MVSTAKTHFLLSEGTDLFFLFSKINLDQGSKEIQIPFFFSVLGSSEH